MKKLVLISSLFLATLASAKEVTVKVNGMVCDFCAQGLSKKLKQEEAVKSFDVNLESKLVKVTMKEGKSLSDDKLKSLVIDSGFNVESIKSE